MFSGWWTKSTLVRGWSCSVAGGQSQHWLEVGHVQWLVDKVNIGQRLVMFSGWWTKSTFVRGWSCSGAGGQSQHWSEVGHVQWLMDKVNIG